MREDKWMPDLFIKRIRKDEERKAPGIHDSIRCWRESVETKDASDDAYSYLENCISARNNYSIKLE